MRYFDEIAKKAYELSMENERAESHDLQIWLEAERIIMARESERKKYIEENRSVQRSWTRV
jgi:hypothetical protein